MNASARKSRISCFEVHTQQKQQQQQQQQQQRANIITLFNVSSDLRCDAYALHGVILFRTRRSHTIKQNQEFSLLNFSYDKRVDFSFQSSNI